MPRYSRKRRRPLRIMGIDPGIRSIGYGVIERSRNGRLRMMASGILVPATDKFTYGKIAKRLKETIERWDPILIGLERLRFAKNEKTAMAVAETTGVIKFIVEEAGIRLKEFMPTEVKLAVTGSGSAQKQDIARMVGVILDLKSAPTSHHASDALGVAITAERFISEHGVDPVTLLSIVH